MLLSCIPASCINFMRWLRPEARQGLAGPPGRGAEGRQQQRAHDERIDQHPQPQGETQLLEHLDLTHDHASQRGGHDHAAGGDHPARVDKSTARRGGDTQTVGLLRQPDGKEEVVVLPYGHHHDEEEDELRRLLGLKLDEESVNVNVDEDGDKDADKKMKKRMMLICPRYAIDWTRRD